jgi:hypothetical protein
MITANANYRIAPGGRVLFDKDNTSVEARPTITYNGTTFAINLGLVVISEIEQVGTPVEPFTEVVGTRMLNLVGDDLQSHEANILALLEDVVAALEKYIGADLETSNPGVIFTQS